MSFNCAISEAWSPYHEEVALIVRFNIKALLEVTSRLLGSDCTGGGIMAEFPRKITKLD